MKTLTLITILLVIFTISGCGQSNSQDNIRATKGGLRGLLFGDNVTANGTGVNQAPETLAADKSNTTIRKEQDGSNDTLLRDDRTSREDSRRGKRESHSLLD